MAETALALRSLEEERAINERAKLKKERKELRRAARAAELDGVIQRVLITAGKQVDLKRFVFKTDEELRALKLSDQQIAIVRQWEQPKRNAAFAVESSSKLMESRLRAQAEKQGTTINVDNMTVVHLPEKRAETVAPVVIDVNADNE